MSSKKRSVWGKRWAARARSALPWALWLGAAGGALVVGQGIGSTTPLPAEAEKREIRMAASTATRVLSREVDPGQVVKAGQVLLRLDASKTERELEIAMAELERLTLEVPARRLDLDQGAEDERNRLAGRAERAELQLAELNGDRRAEQAELDALSPQVERQKDLVERGLTSSKLLEELQLKATTLRGRLGEYDALVAALKSHATSARARIRALDARKPSAAEGEDDDRIKPLRAAIRAQEQRVAQLQDQLAAAVVRAPSDGVVSAVTVEPGAAVALGDPVVSLVRTDARRAVVWADARRARALALGDPCSISMRGRAAGRQGVVVGLGPAVVEVPARFRAVASVPMFARPVYVDVDGDVLLPGERLEARCAGSRAE